MPPLPILPILTALSPLVAKMIHEVFRESDRANNRESETVASQQRGEAFKLIEERIAELQELWITAERKLAVAEDRLAEAQKKRGWWPWSKG